METSVNRTWGTGRCQHRPSTKKTANSVLMRQHWVSCLSSYYASTMKGFRFTLFWMCSKFMPNVCQVRRHQIHEAQVNWFLWCNDKALDSWAIYPALSKLCHPCSRTFHSNLQYIQLKSWKNKNPRPLMGSKVSRPHHTRLIILCLEIKYIPLKV